MLPLYVSSISANPFTANPIKALHFATPYQSTRMSKIKNGGLDQYGAEPFQQQQFGTAGVKGVNANGISSAAQQRVGLVSASVVIVIVIVTNHMTSV